MRNGRRLAPAISLDEIRKYARDQLADLPAALKRLDPFSYRVEIGSSLRAMAAELDRSERAGSASL
jgi:nicotinate phosphoribosyltransferase